MHHPEQSQSGGQDEKSLGGFHPVVQGPFLEAMYCLILLAFAWHLLRAWKPKNAPAVRLVACDLIETVLSQAAGRSAVRANMDGSHLSAKWNRRQIRQSVSTAGIGGNASDGLLHLGCS
jgi:hypothetical protein